MKEYFTFHRDIEQCAWKEAKMSKNRDRIVNDYKEKEKEEIRTEMMINWGKTQEMNLIVDMNTIDTLKKYVRKHVFISDFLFL